MKHQPERTCIGCKGVFNKKEVVRIVAAPAGAVIDYREKLPGRAAYVCPRMDCIAKALAKGNLSRALHLRVIAPEPGAFAAALVAAVREKAKSLVAMAAKAGKLAAGYSAVLDSLAKGRVEVILCAEDIADGTREKIVSHGAGSVPQVSLFTRGELGRLLDRELVGVAAIEDKGLADAVQEEIRRLNCLINKNE